jgi:hypothetical protein
MGLIVTVYHPANNGVIDNYSNGGFSAHSDKLCLVNVPGPSEPGPGCDAALLDSHYPGCLRILQAGLGGSGYVPVTANRVGPMMGGCYAGTPDSRFSEACERLLGHPFYGAVAIHDRWED